MAHDWIERFAGEGVNVAGVLSGTSADGIDVGLARIRAARPEFAALEVLELLAFETIPFAGELESRIRRALDAPDGIGLREVALLQRDLGRAFGRAVRKVASRAKIEVQLVGSHGQTVFHHDGVPECAGASLQLGDGDFVAAEAGCPVVSEFRQGDLAAGGEGAPLSPLADPVIYAGLPRPLALLNLGGISNLTYLAEDASKGVAFDSGPANSLLDGVARARLDRAYDEGGAVALAGNSDERLLARLLEHPYFAKAIPKSTGRDTFGANYVDEVLQLAPQLSDADLLATCVELVAATVANDIRRFVANAPRELILCGGGAHNRALVRALERRTGCTVSESDAHGVPADARESLVFAVLAAARVLDIGVTRTWATGAPDGLVLGKRSR
ncbi:MAG: anhydro-N-acetylmuramic acid kinase [Planctomycetota bacterium]